MSRVQLALRVPDLPASIASSHSKLFGTEPAKLRGGYADFAIADQGLATDVENDTARCHALQDKVWVHGPGQEPWEAYAVEADADSMAKGCPVICGGSACGVRCGASQGGGAPAYWTYAGVPTTPRGAAAVIARPPGITGQPLGEGQGRVTWALLTGPWMRRAGRRPIAAVSGSTRTHVRVKTAGSPLAPPRPRRCTGTSGYRTRREAVPAPSRAPSWPLIGPAPGCLSPRKQRASRATLFAPFPHPARFSSFGPPREGDTS